MSIKTWSYCIVDVFCEDDAEGAESIMLGNEFHISSTRIKYLTTQCRNSKTNVKRPKTTGKSMTNVYHSFSLNPNCVACSAYRLHPISPSVFILHLSDAV